MGTMAEEEFPEFADFLRSHRIDAAAFEKAEPEEYAEWQRLYQQVHPNSFYELKRFRVNPIRRRYHYKPDESGEG